MSRLSVGCQCWKRFGGMFSVTYSRLGRAEHLTPCLPAAGTSTYQSNGFGLGTFSHSPVHLPRPGVWLLEVLSRTTLKSILLLTTSLRFPLAERLHTWLSSILLSITASSCSAAIRNLSSCRLVLSFTRRSHSLPIHLSHGVHPALMWMPLVLFTASDAAQDLTPSLSWKVSALLPIISSSSA
ncbi:hypothetical protein ARMSODRAFT_297369 [Armillaria solidipes]|uniref:Uncharacterized protein n=1 Tax=Armillaria solidipes TaxID=1076256 RepID=A0A2H3BDF5_9AGAR|nr:hypothetical protein ARMSODRAFT_297369 [Armillaria solidipes]